MTECNTNTKTHAQKLPELNACKVALLSRRGNTYRRDHQPKPGRGADCGQITSSNLQNENKWAVIIVLLVLDISNPEWSKRNIAGISSQILRGQAGLALDSLSLESCFYLILIQII